MIDLRGPCHTPPYCWYRDPLVYLIVAAYVWAFGWDAIKGIL